MFRNKGLGVDRIASIPVASFESRVAQSGNFVMTVLSQSNYHLGELLWHRRDTTVIYGYEFQVGTPIGAIELFISETLM